MVSLRRLAADLGAELEALASARSEARAQLLIESALLRAGELETLLADRGSPATAHLAALNDQLAAAAVGSLPSALAAPDLVRCVEGLPAELRISPPESFAYYALQPQSLARLAQGLSISAGAAAVIGIRTIGTTLSAVVTAALRRRGVRAERLTVRPTGHRYDRALHPSPDALGWIVAQRDRGADFFIVDEGPGMSGSSFLAVGEALVRAGVEARRITFLGTRTVNPRHLLTRDAACRYAAFAGLLAAPTGPLPEGAVIDAGRGQWRARFFGDEARWPASWPELERAKYLSLDGGTIFKFEGLGRWGEAVRERAGEIAAAGFGPQVVNAGSGFVASPVIAGRPLARADISLSLVERLADYCAFRGAAFGVADLDPDLEEMREMVRRNSEATIGRVIDAALPLERPVIADARLHLHEWIISPAGAVLKLDAAAHGDDHGFPGPTDVAWDLAGAVVEWELDSSAQRAFLERYARASGDRAERRLPGFVTAYLLSQLARVKMAASALAGTPEATRLLRDFRRYRRKLRWALERR